MVTDDALRSLTISQRLLGTEGPIFCHARIDPRENVWPLVPPNSSNMNMMECKP